VTSSPAVPCSFDEGAEQKAAIIHDPLQTGVAVMLAECAALSAERARAFASITLSETKEVARNDR
jgi:hypothetical protein